MVPLRLTLAALPWSSTSRPSAALGALAAYARDELPDAIVRSRSEYATIAAALGDRLYTHIAEGAYQICARFGATSVEDRHQVKATLDRLVAARLVFEEGDRYLSIAVAQSVAAAMRRIRASREPCPCGKGA